MTEEKRYDVFLSYNSADRDATETLARWLRQERLEPFLDRWYLVPGRPWPQALEEALAASRACVMLLGPQGLGRWQKREMWVALDRQARDPTFPVIPVLLPGSQEVPSLFLACNTWVDLRWGVDDEVAFHHLLAGIRGEPPGPKMEEFIAVTIRPYVGLWAFREEDARFFCGREEFTKKLGEAVGRSSFLAVVGASGSGKSSVVQAGLVPALQRGEVEGGATWEVAVFTPGDAPLRRMAAPLVALLEPEMDEITRLGKTAELAGYFRTGQVTLRQAAEEVLEKQPGTERLLLVADQFEELFTLSRDEAERALFLEQLLAATAGRGAVTALLALRGDFYDRCLKHRPLADRLDGRVVNLGPMKPKELRRAIVEPAEAVGLRFESGLAERILEDVAEEPGGLPLLEFALTELWERRRAGLLTHEAYEEIGEVAGAIARRAEAEYERLEDKRLARRVFLRLVAPGEGTEDTRRRATLSELVTCPDEAEAVEAVVQALAAPKARLVTTGRDEATGQETVEVAHEALIRGWERLRMWVDEDREFLTWRQRLEAALREWQRLERDEGTLLRGGRLAEAERWLAERPEGLSPDEQAYIQESVALRKRERERREREERRQRELESTRKLAEVRQRSMKWLWIAFVVSLVLALLMVYFGVRAIMAEQNVRQQANFAQSLALAGQAQLDLDGVYLERRAVLLGLEALENYPYTWQAERALGQAVHQSRIGRMLLILPSQRYSLSEGPSWSPDGTRVTATGSGGAQVWDANTGEELLSLPHPRLTEYSAWSSDGTRILTVSIGGPNGDGTARVWDAATGEELLTIRLFEEGDESATIYSVTWSPEGTRLLSNSGDNTRGVIVQVWDAVKDEELLSISGSRPVWSPDGKYILFKCDEAACVVDAATGEEQFNFRHPSPVFDVAWSPDRGHIFTGDEDGTIKVWDATTGEELLTILSTHGGGVKEMRWSPNGGRLLARDERLSIHIWDAVTGEQLCTIPNDSDLVGRDSVVDWSPDGTRIVTSGSFNYTARVWDVATGQILFTFYGGAKQVYYPTWSPDGTRILTVRRGFFGKGWATIWNTITDATLLTLSGHTDTVYGAAWSPDGARTVTASGDGTARVWDVNAASATEVSEAVLTFSGHTDAVYSAAWSSDGKRIVTVSDDGTAKVWDADTGEGLLTFSGHTDAVYSAAWSPDGARIVTAGEDRTAKVWDAATGEKLLTFSDYGVGLHSAAWSPDGKHIVTVSDYYPTIVWDAATGEDLLTFSYGSGLHSAWWSPDGARIVTAGEDRTAKVWDSNTGKLLLELSGHTAGVTSAGWSPNGERIVTASGDMMRVWNAATGAELLALSGHAGGVHSVAWSPDGTRIITASDDGTAKVWRVWQTKEDLIDYARQYCAVHKLTDEEREQFGLPPLSE